MKLPKSKDVYISKEKLTEYILSETHTVGKLKARFFRAIGFDKTNVDELEKALLTIAKKSEVKEVMSSKYGKKYIIEAKVTAPIGIKVKLQTVWIIETGEDRPRFVTVYPV